MESSHYYYFIISSYLYSHYYYYYSTIIYLSMSCNIIAIESLTYISIILLNHSIRNILPYPHIYSITYTPSL
jgi:hypothetical protein